MFAPTTYCFFGTSPDFVLIIAGIHTSEQSGVEIANWIRVIALVQQRPRTLAFSGR